MKGLAAKLLMGAGIFAIGAGTPRERVAGPLDYSGNNSSKNISYEGEKSKKSSEYNSYLPKENKEFLERANYIDSAWGNKYHEKIDEAFWLKQTKGIVDGNLAYALGIKESSANPNAKQGRTGASGFWQTMKKTWEEHSDLPFEKAVDFYENQKVSVKNLRSAIGYLENRIENWDELALRDKQMMVLASHNWGQGNVKNVKGDLYRAPFETRDLIQKVMTVYDHFNYLDNREQMDREIEPLEAKKISFVVPVS